MSSQLEKIQELIEKRQQARVGGGEKAIEKQHERGKYTARERIAQLLWSMFSHRISPSSAVRCQKPWH